MLSLSRGEGQGEDERSAKPFSFFTNAIRPPPTLARYLIEAACLSVFMVSAGVFTALLEYPNSSRSQRHLQTIFSPRSERPRDGAYRHRHHLFAVGREVRRAHESRCDVDLLPSRKSETVDALFYPIFQTLGGGVTGVLLVKLTPGNIFTETPVNYVVTVPGKLALPP